MRTALVPVALLALGLAAAPATADRIYTTDGKTITDVKIVEEGLQRITYREGRNDRTVDSTQVLRVEFEEMPRTLDEAFASIADGDPDSGIILLEDYVGGVLAGKEERRHKWAPAHAAWRVVELKASMGDQEGAKQAAGIVIDNFADTRYLPDAYMARAEAAYQLGDAATAQATLKDFQSAIATRGMDERWAIECELALVTTDDGLTGAKRRGALEKVADKAGSKHGTVRNAALVAIGESYLADLAGSPDRAGQNVPAALALFEEVIADPRASDATLAGAYAGKGDCLFQEAAPAQDTAMLKEALLCYLRVAAVYSEQARYVPKALFYAGRCLDLMEDDESKDRAQQLYGQVYFLYPDSPWAREAANFSRR